MKSVKRIEIVIDAAHTPAMIKAVKAAGAPAYTLFKDVHGDGDRGERAGDELGNVFRNCCLVIAVDQDLAKPIAEAAQPLLKRYGGMCLVSDASYLLH